MSKSPLVLLKSTLNAVITHPVIFFPFCILTFIQLFILEIIFYAPRYPLSVFFGPVIQKMEGDIFLHYPYNFQLLIKWFSSNWIQVPVFLIFYSFFLGQAVLIINAVNNRRKIRLLELSRQVLSSYAHLIVASGLLLSSIYGLSVLYGHLYNKAVSIQADSGLYFFLKDLIIQGLPFARLMIGAVTITLLAFVIPIIVLEKKNVFAALMVNFRKYWKTFGVLFFVIFLFGLLYIPIILLRTYQQWYDAVGIPELWGWLLVAGVFVMMFIDTLRMTAITTYYLYEKESGA